MVDRFEAMSTLLAVVDRNGFSAASRALGVPVATLSRRVSDLEATLGARLLVRTTRKLSLTDVGLAYVASARRILEQVEDAEREATGEFVTPKGELVVAAPILFGRLHLLPVITDFLALFPEVDVRLQLADRNVHLIDDRVDMAVRIGALPDSGLIATRVGALRSVLCASPGLLASHGEPGSPLELARWPTVAHDILSPLNIWRFRAPDTDLPLEVPITPRLTVTTAEAAIDAAVRGVGLTRQLCYQAAEAVNAGTLKVILTEFEPDTLPVHLLHAGRGQMPLKMRRFLDFAAPRLRSALSLGLPC